MCSASDHLPILITIRGLCLRRPVPKFFVSLLLTNLVVYSKITIFATMKQITNPTRFYKEGITKAKIDVPDYDGVIARDRRSQDMSIRLASEIQRYNDAGGCCVFVTFTYRDENLTKHVYRDGEDYYSFPCFNRRDKDRYLNSLRCFLYDNFSDFYDNMSSQETNVPDELPFRYSWASEYGKTPGSTRRPHYHCLFFFPPLIWQNIVNVHPEPIKYMKWLVGHLWQHGFVLWSDEKKTKKYPILVTTEFAARYVSKYCMKDLKFFEQPDVNKYIYPHGEFNQERYDLLKKKGYAPFHVTSNHVGENLKNLYNTVEDFRDGIILDNSVYCADKQHGIQKRIKPPLYIHRKRLMKYIRVSQRYVYTDFGRKIMVEKYVSDFENKVKKLKLSIQPLEIRKKLEDNEIKVAFEKYGYENAIQLSLNLTSILINDNKIREFLLYMLSWRGREVCSDFYREEVRVSLLSSDAFYNESLELYYMSMDHLYYDDYVEEGYYKIHRPMILYDRCKRFENFNHVAELLSLMSDTYSQKIITKYNDDREKRLESKYLVS